MRFSNHQNTDIWLIDYRGAKADVLKCLFRPKPNIKRSTSAEVRSHSIPMVVVVVLVAVAVVIGVVVNHTIMMSST